MRTSGEGGGTSYCLSYFVNRPRPKILLKREAMSYSCKWCSGVFTHVVRKHPPTITKKNGPDLQKQDFLFDHMCPGPTTIPANTIKTKKNRGEHFILNMSSSIPHTLELRQPFFYIFFNSRT